MKTVQVKDLKHGDKCIITQYGKTRDGLTIKRIEAGGLKNFIHIVFENGTSINCSRFDEAILINELGTPLSELSGQPGTLKYAEFKRIAESWGYE